MGRIIIRVVFGLLLALFAVGVYRFIPLPASVRTTLELKGNVREGDRSGKIDTKQGQDIVLPRAQPAGDPKAIDEEIEAYSTGRLPYYHSDEAVAPPPAPAAVPPK
jgi:hypothetical protein